MKKFTSLLFFIILSLIPFSSFSQMIKTKTPPRPKGQTDVLRLTAPALPVVRVAFIGLGMRGSDAVVRMTNIKGVEIVALCDMLEDRTKASNNELVKRGFPLAQEFYGENAWKQVTKLPNVDLIYIATDWLTHASIGVQAMKDGKHVAIEVPGALTMKEIWELIDTSEKTR
jgi:predicted dehydrogenase